MYSFNVLFNIGSFKIICVSRLSKILNLQINFNKNKIVDYGFIFTLISLSILTNFNSIDGILKLFFLLFNK